MKFVAEIDVMPLKALLDPQGKAVEAGLKNMGLTAIKHVRVGKHITLEIEADNETEAQKQAKEACEKLLHNPIMEYYELTLKQV